MKRIVLILIIIICSGCEANYDIFINKDGIKDDFNASISINENITDFRYQIYTSIGDDLFRDTSKYSFNDSGDSFNYNNNYSFEQFKNSILLNECFKDVTYSSDKGVLNIKLESFLCFDNYASLDSVIINVNTDLEVINSNYDQKDNNKYIWTINKNNYKEKEIVLNIRYNNNIKNLDSKKIDNYIDVFFYSIILMVFICLLVIYIKSKKSNK